MRRLSRSPSAAISLPGHSDADERSDNEPIYVSDTLQGLEMAASPSGGADAEEDIPMAAPLLPRLSIKGVAARHHSTSSWSSAAARATATAAQQLDSRISSGSASSERAARKAYVRTSQGKRDLQKERSPVASTLAGRLIRDRSRSMERARAMSDVEMDLGSDYERERNGATAIRGQQELEDSSELESDDAAPGRASLKSKKQAGKQAKRPLTLLPGTKPLGTVKGKVWALKKEYSKQHYLKGELPFEFVHGDLEDGALKAIKDLVEAPLTSLSLRGWMTEQERRENRSLQGPELPGEFDYEVLRAMHQRPRAYNDNGTLLTTKQDAILYDQVMKSADATEIPSSAPSGLQPRRSQPFHPPWELVYTNRVVYPPTVVPQTTAGCNCTGNCQDNPECSCRLRQALASRTRTWELEEFVADHGDPVQRSGITSFAYDFRGCIKPGVLRSREPIYECGLGCSCEDSCQNRVIGLGFSVPTEIFWTEAKRGWGVRVPPSFKYIVPAGKPLGIYAGVLAADEVAKSDGESDSDEASEPDLLELIGRNYHFALDFPCALEAAQEAAVKKRLSDAKEQLRQTVKGSVSTSSAGISASVSVKVAASATATAGVPTAMSPETSYTTDAMHMGSWTRFVNHGCFPTVHAIPVYIEDMAPRRPLLVYVASKDIKPGQELTISYYGDEPRVPKKGVETAKWKEESRKARDKAIPSWRCYCGMKGCRGVMFKSAVVEDEEEDEAPVPTFKLKPKGKGKGKAAPTATPKARSKIQPVPPPPSRPSTPSRPRVTFVDLPVSPGKGKSKETDTEIATDPRYYYRRGAS